MSEDHIKTLDIERININAFDDNLRDIQNVYAQFQQLGVSSVPSSRINSYRVAFESLKRASNENRLPTLSLMELMLQATIEAEQLKTIIKAATTSPNQESWKDQLRRLISGEEIPNPDSKHSPARDFQFESHIAAVAELSGYQVSFAEPDILIQHGAYTFGLAAKRLYSKSRIEKNCRKAAHQIRQSGLPGIIALDVSFALYPAQCINTNDLLGGLAFVQAATNNFVAKYYGMFRRVCRDDSVLGVLVCLQLPVLNYDHPPAPQLATSVRWLLAPYCEPDDERRKWILEFAAKCELGLFGPRQSESA